MNMNNENTFFYCLLTCAVTVAIFLLLVRPIPIVNSMDKPFIIEKIGNCNNHNGMVKYFGKTSAANMSKPVRPCIVAPSRMYNVGDTIYITTGANMRKINQIK